MNRQKETQLRTLSQEVSNQFTKLCSSTKFVEHFIGTVIQTVDAQ